MPPVLRLHACAFGTWALAVAVLVGAVVGASGDQSAAALSGDSGSRPAAVHSSLSGTDRSSIAAADDTSAGDTSADIELVVAPREPVIAAADDEVQFGLLIRNSTTTELPGGTVTLVLDARQLSDPADLDAALPGTATHFAEATLDSTAPGADQTATITVPRADLPIDADAAAGAYRVGATVQFAEAPEPGFAVLGAEPTEEPANIPTTLSTKTSIVWKGAAAQTVPLSIIVPFVLPPDIRTLPTRGQLEDLVPGWDRLLTAARVHEATLAIDPRLIAGIRAYGDEAPRNAQLLLSRLETTPLPSFLLQFADADPSAQAALGFTTLLEPTNLDFVSRFGSFAETTEPTVPAESGADSAASDPAGTGSDQTDAPAENDEPAANDDAGAADGVEADPDTGSELGASALPTLNELLAWPQEETAYAWPAGGRADPDLLSLLDSEGIDALVLSSDGVQRTGGPRGSLGDDSVTVTESGLDGAARIALEAETETERSGGVARLAAELVVDAQGGSDGVVLALDRGATSRAADPAALLEQLETFAWITPTSVADQRTGSFELQHSGTSQDRLELLRSASNREGSVNEVGAVLTHPEYLSGYQRTRLLELFSTQYAGDGDGFSEVAADFRKRDAELLGGVQAVSTEHIQLVGSSSRVPVQLRNALPFDAEVTVDVDPASAALSVEERRFRGVIVPAETTERVLVPVRSRVSSGESGLVVSVSAASGTPTVFTGTLPITIRSSIETIIFWALGGLAVLLLVFGTVRSVRRRRARAAPNSGSSGERQDPAAAM